MRAFAIPAAVPALTCIGFFLFSMSASAVPPSAKPAQVLTLIPQSVSPSGDVYAYDLGSGDTYRWEASTKTQTPIFKFTDGIYNNLFRQAPDFRPKSTAAAEGSVVISRPLLTTNSKYRFQLSQASQPTLVQTIEETRYLTGAPVPSPDGQSYAFAGSIEVDNYYYVGNSLWTLNLSEYLWDLNLNLAQPTGFYLTKVFQGNPSTLNPTRYVYADKISTIGWSSDSKKLAFGLTAYDPRGFQKDSIQIHDIGTGKTEEAFPNTFAQELFWITADTLFSASMVANSIQLHRIDLKNKTSTRPLPEAVEPYTISIAPDESFVAYNPSPFPDPSTGIQTRAAPVLYDLKNKKRYSVEGATQMRLSADGKHVAISRSSNDASKPEAPILVAQVRDIVAAATAGQVRIKDVLKVATAVGSPIIAYHPPANPKEFWSEFEIQTPQLTIVSSYYSGTVEIKNKSDAYYALRHQEDPAVVCNLYDETGALLTKHAAYPIDERYNRALVINPGNTATHRCFGQVVNTVPYGTRGKLVIHLSGYEAASRVEFDYVF